MGIFSKKSNPAPGSFMPRVELLSRLLAFNDQGPFSITPGVDTDLLFSNEAVNKSWATGKKKVSYQARLLLDEATVTAYFWELLKETSSGIQFSIGVEKTRIKGKELFHSISEKGYGLNGEPVYDYQFDYGSLREALKQVIEQAGWRFKLVLTPGKTKR